MTIFPFKNPDPARPIGPLFAAPPRQRGFRRNNPAAGWPHAVTILCLIALLFRGGMLNAQEGAAEDAESGKTPPVQITAQNLVADDVRKTATFSGEVRAVQGDTVILSDRLIIRYEGNPMDETRGAGENQGAGGIRELEAEGNVRITFDEIVAESPKAVYTPADRVLVLSGPGSRVTRPESGTISGKTITVYRDDGRIRFEGGVEGLFFPGDAGLE